MTMGQTYPLRLTKTLTEVASHFVILLGFFVVPEAGY